MNQIDPRLVEFHKNYSKVDYALYEQFNKTFWRKVAAESDFASEVKAMQFMLDDVVRFCASKAAKLVVAASKWTTRFSVAKAQCQKMKIMPEYWTPYLWAKMPEKLANVNITVPIV